MFSRLSVFLAPVLLCAAAPALAAGFDDCPQFFSGKPPSTTAYGQLRELCLDEYAVLHSGQSKTPIFVAQRLNARMLNLAKDLKRKDKFREDARLPERERARLSDYRSSGFSRGHMAAAADMSTEQGKAQSYLLSNMVPQDITQNGKAWSQIEQDTRRYIRRAQGDVFVITGPVFGKQHRTIGDGQVWVPDAVFKMVYDPSTGQRWVHLQDNQPSTKAGPPISYAEFVQRTGIRLLD
ncbi:endonuclease G [Comamonas sp. BIGb0152]|uniref:DNA/RNA non-specific endonuclease n=1 Tax=Comamonas sp. BIGb0152 TaxID=2940601 RepID=UPI002169576E|nr:DNA/RNA non-specific endonuclease [Comamonas sp. BIGb0152]MCS4293397.1 endonuclease G [Comamonas sp. BIGb0152]